MPVEDEPIPGAVIRPLDDGLVLRWGRRSDAEPLAELNARVFQDPRRDEPNDHIRHYTADLVGRPHPTMEEGYVMVVEDTRAKRPVSSMCLIPQTWRCEDLPFPLCRPEIVGTHRDYRRRGLVRAQFEAFHAWSDARGDRMQAITGIPWYYRQFGYELALDQWGGHVSNLALPADESDAGTSPYRVRPAAVADIPFMASLYEVYCREYLYTCVMDDTIWRYELEGRDLQVRRRFCIVETRDGTRAGAFEFIPRVWEGRLSIYHYQLAPGHSYRAVTPVVIETLKEVGEAKAAEKGTELNHIHWAFGVRHPVYDAFPESMTTIRQPYAWYIRVSDIPGFIQFLTPVLERRLAASPFAGHTGEVRVNGFRWGMKLTFDHGRLASVSPWENTDREEVAGDFPDLTFLILLMGRRTIDEICHVIPDCRATEEGNALLSALFPKRPSRVYGIG